MKKLFSLFLFLNYPLFAFTLNNNVAARFANNDVQVNVENSSACSGLGLSNDEILDMSAEAVTKFWNTVTTSRLRVNKGSLVNISNDFHTLKLCSSGSYNTQDCVPNSSLMVPNDILISCNSESDNFGAGVLAAAIPNNFSSENIIGSLILINEGGQFGSKSRDEQVSIIAHEIGHAIGLGHTNLTSNLMHAQSLATRFRLGQDDRDGVTWLYPQNQPISCGSIQNIDKKSNSFFLQILFGFLLMSFFFFLFIKVKNSSSF